MPAYQTMAERANLMFSRDNIGNVDAEMFAPGADLADGLRSMEIAKSNAEKAFMAGWPRALREVIRSTIYTALTRSPRVPVTFAWKPAYDYEVHVWDAPGTATTMGGTTVLLGSRYPDDIA